MESLLDIFSDDEPNDGPQKNDDPRSGRNEDMLQAPDVDREVHPLETSALSEPSPSEPNIWAIRGYPQRLSRDEKAT